ncbi:hypothetical protein ACG33_01165 [Steroidobacter denitrificans]|uniref:Uncharacterized protein n=1 Tax=Steroidobacter denitrificans TaxID=465721 RepID=A0A127F5M0_STEDE|nr:hypothetical protein ACG33_01165 [Steroidobacter denitrificans]
MFCSWPAGNAGDLIRRRLQIANRIAKNVRPQILMGQMEFCSSRHRNGGAGAGQGMNWADPSIREQRRYENRD